LAGQASNAFLFDFAPDGVYQASDVTTRSGELLPRLFTMTLKANKSIGLQGCLFSAALSLGSPPLDVIQHPALWSPDFPPNGKTIQRLPRQLRLKNIIINNFTKSKL